MSLEEDMKNGLVYCEYGHTDEKDILYENKIEALRVACKDKVFHYNHTLPSLEDEKKAILKDLLGHCPDKIWVEAPMHFAYGKNTYIGENFYANFNFTVVDDIEVHIGHHVMMGPNVTLSVTGHPLDKEYRSEAAQFSMPITIGNHVWIGSNVVVLPGVTIGDNSVIGAGSVVTHDIAANTLAYGTPCRAIREIGEYDKTYYSRNRKFNKD